MKKTYRIIVFALLILLVSNLLVAQTGKQKKPLTRILFVFDASQSMLGKWNSDRKITVARNLLIEMADSISTLDNVEMALRVYGHQSYVPPQDCNDTKLEVPFSKNNIFRIKQVLRSLSPKGTTPIAHSLELAGGDFPKCDDCRNIIILITDGIEACDGDPCAVSLALQKEGIVLKPFVIGIGLDLEFKETFKCVGNYFNASDEKKFKEVFGVVISQALNSTTAQVNLLDEYGQPTETDVNMTFYDNFSGRMMHNYVHTINNRGNPDTIVLDPLIKYDMVVSTIPPVRVDSIVLTPGKHTIIAADTPQGTLEIKNKSIEYRNLQFIVKENDKCEILNFQDINQPERYITGTYDIEILTLPRIVIDDINIKQSYTTTLEIPNPGLATFLLKTPGYGSVYVMKDNQLVWIKNLKTNVSKETLVLQPGNYFVSFRSKNAKKTLFTNTKSFKIRSGGSAQVILY